MGEKIRSALDDALGPLQKEFGDVWEVWYVINYVRPATWCARLHTNHRTVLNAPTADALRDMLNGKHRDEGQIFHLRGPQSDPGPT